MKKGKKNPKYATVSITTPFKFGEHVFPLDLTVTNLENRQESEQHRVQKILENASDRKFDKVLKRIKPLILRKKCSHANFNVNCALKTDIVYAMNKRVGRLRFLEKQLDLSVQTGERTPFVQRAELDDDQLPSLLHEVKRRCELTSLEILIEFKPRILQWASGWKSEGFIVDAMKKCTSALCTNADVNVDALCDKVQDFSLKKEKPKRNDDNYDNDLEDDFHFHPHDIGWYGDEDNWDIGAGCSSD